MYEFAHTQINLPQEEEYPYTAILYTQSLLSSCSNLLIRANVYASQQYWKTLPVIYSAT